jgi:hypothetical protein
MAWESLPPANRQLLELVGACQWEIVGGPLGFAVDEYLRSAGSGSLGSTQRRELDRALGVWVRELRVVLINGAHPQLDGLDDQSLEAFLSHIAWHEWAHALSVVRCSADDVAAGKRLLALAPDGIRDRIRLGRYARKDLTHELVAESYALLMVRRLAGRGGRPSWLHEEIYDLVARVTGWSG